MSSRAPTDTEWSDAEEMATHRAVLFKKCVEAGAAACARGDFQEAIRLYQDAIELDPTNHVLYSNRSAIYCKLGSYETALADACKSYELKPSWNKALYRKGYALKCMGQYVQALQAYSTGLAQDPKNRQLLLGVVECVQQCPMNERFTTVFEELKTLGFDKNAFVLISVIGQELLSAGYTAEAIDVLENALKIDTTNLELRQSVLSALSSAFWTLGAMKKAIPLMEQDLSIALSLGNTFSEMRARGNLGMAHLAVGNLQEALNNYRHHLMLTLRCNDNRSASSTLSTMGQIYIRLFDYPNALASFEQCLELCQQQGDATSSLADGPTVVDVYRQYGYMGDVYLSMGRDADAERMYRDYMTSSKADRSADDESRANLQLGLLYQYRGDLDTAARHFVAARKLSRQREDRSGEMRACGHLCQLCLTLRRTDAARRWAERQLQLALVLGDVIGESRACADLGAVAFETGDVENARKIFQRQLDVARSGGVGDKTVLLKAYRNLGLCYTKMKRTRDALDCHTQELSFAKESNDKVSACLAHGYLATVHQQLHDDRSAESHLHAHWSLAKETNDLKTELLALRNVGRFYVCARSPERSVEYFEKFLMLSQERNDVDAEKEACRELGQTHYRLKRFREAARYFDQELALAKDLRDHRTMARAYRDLGLVRLALDETDEAMECQKYFLALAHIARDAKLKLQALHNVGNVLLRLRKYGVALKIFLKQLNLAKACRLIAYQCTAYGKLGQTYDGLCKFERAHQCYAEQLRLARQESPQLQFDAFGQLASHFHLRSDASSAVRAYENQLECARRFANPDMEAESLSNLCELCLGFSMYDDATRYLQERVKLLSRLSAKSRERNVSFRRALLDLAKCYERTQRVVDALKIFTEYVDSLDADDDDVDESEYGLANTNISCERVDKEKTVETVGVLKDFACLWFRVGNFRQALENLSLATDVLQRKRGKSCKDQSFSSHTVLFEVLLYSIYCHLCSSRLDTAVERVKDLLAFCRDNSLARLESKALLIYARVSIRRNCQDSSAFAMKLANDALTLAKRYDDPEVTCSCLLFFGAHKQLNHSIGVDSFYYQQILDIATARNLDHWKLISLQRLGFISFLCGNHDFSRTLLNQALNLAVSLNDLKCEVEIRILNGLIHWSQRRLTEAKSEFESCLKIIEKRSFYLDITRIGDFGGETPLRLAETLCTLHMLLLASMNLKDECLLLAEKCRYFRFLFVLENVGVDARKRISILPTFETIQDRLDSVSAQNAAILYYFSIENYLMTWICKKDSCSFSIKQVNASANANFNENVSLGVCNLELPWSTLKKFALDTISATVPFTGSNFLCNSIDYVQRDLDQLISNNMKRVTIIGFEEIIDLKSKHDACIVYDLALTNLHPVKTSANANAPLTPGLVIDAFDAASARASASALCVDVLSTRDASKEDLLEKMTRSRCVHLNVRVSPNAEDPHARFQLDAEEDACVTLSRQDVLKLTLRADVVALSTRVNGRRDDASRRRLLIDLASAFVVAGCRSVLYVKSDKIDDEDKRSAFFQRFYERLSTSRESMNLAATSACDASEFDRNEIVLFRDADVVLEQNFCRLNRPLRLLLQTPDECREAMLVILHLVEKSLQRINTGVTTPMFTNEQSVRNKAGPEVHGVFELLEAFGFRREFSRSQKSAEVADLYFPLTDVSGCLNRGSVILQAFLSLPQGMYVAFSKLLRSCINSSPLLTMLETIERDLCTSQKLHNYQLKVKRNLYSTSGAVELFAALGFDKLKETEEETILESIRVELTNKKLQNTLTCLRAVFEDVARCSPNDGHFSSQFPTVCNDGNWSSSTMPRRKSSISTPTILNPNTTDTSSKIRDLDLTTDLSGVDSDFPLDESLFAMSLERPAKSKSSRNHRLGGKMKKLNGKKNFSGYMSEGDLKGGLGNKPKTEITRCSSRGYHSEDENKAFKPLTMVSMLGDDQQDAGSPFEFESTAQVISVDERDSPFEYNNRNELSDADDSSDIVNQHRPLSPPPFAPPPIPSVLASGANSRGNMTPGKSPQVRAPSQLPHEYARLESPSPSYYGRSAAARVVMDASTPCRASPVVMTSSARPTPSTSCRASPVVVVTPSSRPPPPPYDLRVARHSPVTRVALDDADDADAIRRAAQKFQRQTVQNSSLSSHMTSSSAYGRLHRHVTNGHATNNNDVYNDHVVTIPSSSANGGNRNFSKQSPDNFFRHQHQQMFANNNNNFSNRTDRLIVTREDSLQSEFI